MPIEIIAPDQHTTQDTSVAGQSGNEKDEMNPSGVPKGKFFFLRQKLIFFILKCYKVYFNFRNFI